MFALSAVACAQEDDARASAERLKAATAHVQKFEMRSANEPTAVVELIPRPLLTYGDAARRNEHGTLWAWGVNGRPVAFMEVYQSSDSNKQVVHAITLTSTTRVVATIPGARQWTPQTTAIDPQPIRQAEPPTAKATGRLTQLKALAGRFTAHEFWDPKNSRFELRLLVQPVYRYSQSDAGIVDGAAFVFAHGTNPEIVLFVEATGDGLETATWRFHAARLGSAELHLLLDEQEVWKQSRTPGVVGQSTDPYWLFFTPNDEPPAGTDQ